MKIMILTAGSRGDTQPYIALGLALQKAGCRVTLAAFENYRAWIEGFGLDFFAVRGDVTKAAQDFAGVEAMQADNPLKVILSFRRLQALAFALQEDFFTASADADAVVYHPGAAVGYFAAQRSGVSSVLAAPFPMTPTRAYPALIFYSSPLAGRATNLLTHKLFERVMWMVAAGPVKQFWKQRFGRAPENFGCPYPRQITRRLPTVTSLSPQVFARPSDWPEHAHADGYWFLDGEPDWSPPAALLDFLAAGPKPVYVGFGSMGSRDGAQTARQVIEALQQAGRRGVLATGWQGMQAVGELPESIYLLESAPHSWLFPHMAAVVHHGGAGTTAAGLRAGVPSVLVPHANDQFAWGRRVFELGAGARPLPRKQLNAARLAAAIDAALQPGVQSAAAALGEKIRSERGADAAAQVIIDSLNA